ncbi:MAG: RecX family transcriptional regulator [Chloroflexi bacterium]|nr:RecX family transcriptional regulator [Chloroflexota bacterium]
MTTNNTLQTITAIKSIKRNKKRFLIILEPITEPLELDLSVINKANLNVGQNLSGNQISDLRKLDNLHNAMNIAVRYLSYHTQSEATIRLKLKQHHFEKDILDSVIQQLQERHLIDDIAFAEYWKESRSNNSPRSKKMIDIELKRKGISNETVSKVTSDIDE